MGTPEFILVSAVMIIMVFGYFPATFCFPAMSNSNFLPDLSSRSSYRPPYVECISSDDCFFDSCCVLGMGRYSIPTCQKKLQLSDYCRPASDEPTNTTITYFDGQVVSLYNVHMIMCPCADGLSCDLKTGSCVNFDGLSNFNAIDVNVFSED